MARHIVLCSRKVRGIGGMQRYTRDLRRALSLSPDTSVALVSPWNVFTLLRAENIHFGDAVLAPLGALLRYFCPQKRVTLTAHGLDIVYPRALYQKLLQWSLKRVDAVLCVSAATAAEVRRRGVPAARTHIIPCGVWPEDCRDGYRLRTTSPQLVSVGRLVPRKGHVWFVEHVLPVLLERYPNMQYHIVGTGSEHSAILKACRRSQCEKHVVLHGALENDDCRTLVQEANLFVMPNVHRTGDMEGFGIACIEASALGTPVVASYCEGLRDAVLPGKTGRFFRVGDPQSAARVIGDMLEHSLHPSVVAKSTQKHFSWEILQKSYRSVLNASPAPNSRPPAPISALLTWDYASAKGGLGRALVQWADRERIDHVFSPSEGYLPWTLRVGGHILFSLLLPFVLQSWIDRKRITHLSLPVGPGGVFLLRKPKRCTLSAIVAHTYSQQARCVPGERWKKLFVPFERRTLAMVSSVQCFVDDTQRELRHRYGISADLTLQPIDPTLWEPPQSQQKNPGLCICVGRISPRKGIDALLRAWPVVRQHVPHATLVLVGRGNISQSLPGMTHFQDISLRDLIELTRRAEVAICPSYLEGYGIACTEAIAAGTPVVASNVPGLRSHVTDDSTGRLVPPGDSEAIAEAIVELLQDDAIARVFRDRARRNLLQQWESRLSTVSV